jgi:NAD(P)-dependent dehydrogenase (short-subunit alcohol dehydrogenase family)
MQFQNRTALVTGAGATGGIGFETARLLAADGAHVVITGRDVARGEQAAQALSDGGAVVRFVAADLTDVASVRALAVAAGEVDVLVNNAATFAGIPMTEQDAAGIDEAFATNVRGPYILTAALVPKMLAKGAGSIVNVTTMAADIGMPGLSVYGATKAAVESLTRTWAAEFGAAGVRVNAVAPGPTRSAKVMGIMGDGAEALGQSTPLARMAEPREIAEVILFLASERASYITGATLAADGGRTAI